MAAPPRHRSSAGPFDAMGRSMCLVAALTLLAGAAPAQATHNPVGACSPGFENVRGVDLETFFDGRANLTICLGGNLTDLGDANVRWSNMRHVTVRSAPGTWRAIRSRIWIDDTNADVSLYGLTLDSGDFVAEPGSTGLAINADNVMLQRNMITNRHGLAGSCITNDATYGVASNLQIPRTAYTTAAATRLMTTASTRMRWTGRWCARTGSTRARAVG